MSFARVRALVVVGVLVLFALVFITVAVARDSQRGGVTAEECPVGWPLADLTLREPDKVKINVYNATAKPRLASSVADDFRNRKFQVEKAGNDPLKKSIDGIAVLRYGPRAVGGAHLLKAYFLNDATAEFDPTRTDDVVDVVIGNSFQQLATTTEVNQSLTDIGSAQLPPNTCPDPNAKD